MILEIEYVIIIKQRGADMAKIKKREGYIYLIVFNERYCYISDSRNSKVHLLANNEVNCRVYDRKGGKGLWKSHAF